MGHYIGRIGKAIAHVPVWGPFPIFRISSQWWARKLDGNRKNYSTRRVSVSGFRSSYPVSSGYRDDSSALVVSRRIGIWRRAQRAEEGRRPAEVTKLKSKL